MFASSISSGLKDPGLRKGDSESVVPAFETATLCEIEPILELRNWNSSHWIDEICDTVSSRSPEMSDSNIADGP